MTDQPDTRYAWNGNVALAYQVFGEGPVDLVYMQGYISHVDKNWESPYLARFLKGLGKLARVIHTDRRAGLHTGEIEYGGHDLAGMGVHIGARVGAMAGSSEVWVSSTVKDLVVGSGLEFEDAGEHELKGVPDRWHLYKVVGP